MKKSSIPFPGINRQRKGIALRLIVFMLLCLPALPAWTATQTVSPRYTVNFTNSSLIDVFDYLGQHSEITFVYNAATVKNSPVKVTQNFKNASLSEVLDACLANSGFGYELIGTSVVIRPKQKVVEEHVIKGKVVNAKNEPLPGVTIRVEGTSVGVASDIDGNFTLRLPMEKGSLLFSFVGFKDQKVGFNGTKPLTVQMEENVAALDEVQVIAYGSQKKRTVISAISSVKADDIKELPTHSLESLLQGHMAGVEVNNVSGSPGGGGSIISIRGYNSFLVKGEGQDKQYGTPLYVVDGVPMQAFTSPITGTNTLSDIDPSMIESIEVLKDAASSAIYGSRAGNGVILITTKKGRAGQAKFTANASYSLSWLPETPVQSGGKHERYWNLMGLQNTITPYQGTDGIWRDPVSPDDIYNYRGHKDYSPVYDWFRGNAGSAQNSYMLQDSLNAFYNNSTDWWRYAYRTAKVYNANVQASGGSEKFRYMVGAGYYKEEGIAINTAYQRVNVMTNLMAQPSKRLRIENQISMTYTDRSRGGNNGGSKIEGISINPMNQSSLLPGGSYVEENMLKILNSTVEKNHGYSGRYNLVLDYEIIRNLRLRLSGGVDFNQQNMNKFEPSTLDTKNHWSVSTGEIGRNIILQNENLLTYDFKIRNKHNFALLLGLSFEKSQYFENKGSGHGGPDDHTQYVNGQWGSSNGTLDYGGDLVASAYTYKSNFEEERLNSYFGRLTYNFQEKYMFEATIRRDGSTVFGENVRWATFPSLAVGWAFSQENFMKPLYWLSFAKVRVSWGKSGQKFGQSYLAHGLLQSGGTFLGNSSIIPNMDGGMINRGLTWQETNQYDIGLDMSFLDYRLKFTFDYYYRYTKGQLQQIPLPGNIYYYSFQWQNALAVSNEGMELELTADIFRETAVKWRMKVNASRNWNRFEKSSDGFDLGNAVIGKPLNQIKVYKTDGFYESLDKVPVVFQANGLPYPLYAANRYGIFSGGMRKVIDIDGDGYISPNADTYYAASPLPQAYGGIINEISWKQFDLNVVLNYSIGRHILKVYDDLSLNPTPTGSRMMVDMKDVHSYTGPGSYANYPRHQMYDRNSIQYEGYFDTDVEKVHFLRLKQLTLGYNLHEQIAKRIGVQGIRFFLTGENLFMLTNYSGLDPEIVDITSGLDRLSSYPLPRKFTIGLTLNF